jgi:hypothetical protein
MKKILSNEEIIAKARQGLCLNLKELAVASGYGYPTVLGWKPDGLPLVCGKITLREALNWVRCRYRLRQEEELTQTHSVLHHPLLAADKSGGLR